MRATIAPQIVALINSPTLAGSLKQAEWHYFYYKSVFLERNGVLLQANGQKRYVNGRKTKLSGRKPMVNGRKTMLSGRKHTVSGRKTNLQFHGVALTNSYLEKKLSQRRLSVWESFF